MTGSDTPSPEERAAAALERVAQVIVSAVLRLEEIEEQLGLLVALASKLRDDVRADRRF